LQDQNLQESGVKVETLERRLEATRKQADQIVELENDVAKAKKQEKVYEDAIEQLQKDLDLLEAENLKLGKGERGDRGGNASGSTTVEAYPMVSTGGLEASQLAEQIENLRCAIRFLRSENALLRSKELYKDLHALPTLPTWHVEAPVPELEPSSPGSPPSPTSSTGSIDTDHLVTPSKPSKHSLEMESRLLYQEIAQWQATPRIVDISTVLQQGTKWHRRKGSPQEQMAGLRGLEQRLRKRVAGLADQSHRSMGS
jgi:dynactin 1